MTPPTLVLVHGAGDSARVWQATQTHLRVASVAVDLLGRGSRPFDLTKVTIDLAAAQAAADVREHTPGSVIVVAHSAGGVIAPRLIALLGPQVKHLVLIAGVTAPEGAIAAMDTSLYRITDNPIEAADYISETARRRFGLKYGEKVARRWWLFE